MRHPFDKAGDCYCDRCIKERLRRATQSALDPRNNPHPKRATRRGRAASRADQHARYIDCGPQAWDDRGDES